MKNKPLFSQPSTMGLAAGITALTLTPSVMAGKAVDPSPNIVFILTDDQGWSQVSKRMHPDLPQSRSNYLSTPS